MEATNFKAHGYITISNLGGIEVMVCDSGDGVYYRYTDGDTTIEEAEIQYDDEGDAYFLDGETPRYLYDVMRTNLFH